MPRVSDSPRSSRVPSKPATQRRGSSEADSPLSPGGHKLTDAQRHAAKIPWGADPETFWKSDAAPKFEKTRTVKKVAIPPPPVSEASSGPGGHKLTAAQREAAKLPWGASPDDFRKSEATSTAKAGKKKKQAPAPTPAAPSSSAKVKKPK